MLCFDVEKMLQEGVSPEAVKVLLAKDLYEHVDTAAQEMERQREAEEKAEILEDCREDLIHIFCEYVEALGLLSEVADEDYVDFTDVLQQSLEKELIALETILDKGPKADKQTKIIPAVAPQKEPVIETKKAKEQAEIPPCISKILPTDAKAIPIELSEEEASEILAKFFGQIK